MIPFERITPEEGGVSSRDILALLESYITADLKEETHSFVLLRHGKLLSAGAYAPYSLKDRNTVFSCSKMFTALAAGFAMAEGLFSEEDAVIDYFPEYLSDRVTERVKTIRVKHLLTMTVGQKGEVVHEGARRSQSEEEEDFASEFFYRECDVEPGTVFRYDGHATYMLSLLVYRTAGEDILAYLKPRLFDPLGMDVPPAIRDKNGIPIGWSGLRLTIGELARMGQLFLDGGRYMGKQLLPEGFVERASLCHIPTDNATGEDWSQGYCYQFWRGRYDTYRFCGALGQMCVIMPKYDAVFVVFSGYDNPHIWRELDKFYEKLMLRFHDAPLPPDEEGNRMLESFIRHMAIPERYATRSPMAESFSGVLLSLDPGTPFTDATLDFSSDTVTVTLGGECPITYIAGLCAPMRTEVDSRKTVVLKSDFVTVYSSTARFEDVYTLLVTTHIVGSPTDMILEVDYKARRAHLSTVRGCFNG